MTKYEDFRDTLDLYFKSKGIKFKFESTLHDSSKNTDQNRYLYNGKKDLSVISLDLVAQNGYKKLKRVPDEKEHKSVNTPDAFLIDSNNEWFFVEFKDCGISKKKDNIEKKGLANWLMLMDIIFDMDENDRSRIVGISNLMKFAREHISYILVFNGEKDSHAYEQVKNNSLINGHYTPCCLYKFKDYFFKDAYAYTEEYFEREFANKFRY